GGDVFFDIVGYRNSIFSSKVHVYRCGYGLEKAFRVNSSQNKAGFVQCLRALSAGSDTDCRERMSHRSEKRTLFRQSIEIRDYSEGVHMQTVVIMEPQRIMLNDSMV